MKTEHKLPLVLAAGLSLVGVALAVGGAGRGGGGGGSSTGRSYHAQVKERIATHLKPTRGAI